MRRAKSGISWVLSGDSAFLWSGDGYLWRLLGFHKGCQVPFLLPRGNVGFLRKHCSIKGPHLAWRGEFHGFCGVVVGSSQLLSSCIGTWGTHSWFLREVRSTFNLRGAPRDSSCIAAQMNRASSRVEARTSGFLSISDIDLRVSVEFEQGRQDLSCVESWNSGSLSSCEWDVRPLVELHLEPVAFSGGCNQGVSAPWCCNSVLEVPFESGLILSGWGNRCLWDCGTTHEVSCRVSM